MTKPAANVPYPPGAIPCLDKGFIRLVDAMGGDAAIVQAARVSYGKGTKKVSQDRGLIRYLMRHRHTTPFEMVELKFHCKMPIFVARQWVRHRTANINEYSLRYSEARNEFYIPHPEHIQFQSNVNKQGRAEEVPSELKQKVQEYFTELSSLCFQRYQELQDTGIARELARAILPVNIYTEWYWKNDLHNTFHFLHLRMDDHAQLEIREYAHAMARLVKEVAPLAYEAFEDYRVHDLHFSHLEKEILTHHIPPKFVADLIEDITYRMVASLHRSKPRTPEELYALYQANGGVDDHETFALKWKASNIPTGNVRELRELRIKLQQLTTSP